MFIATKAAPYRTGLVLGGKPWVLQATRRVEKAAAHGRETPALPARTRRDMFRAVLFVVSGLLMLTAFGLSAKAGGTHVLVIPLDDGYGLSDCLTENASCGPMVASAWCKAKGHGASGTLGPAAAQATASDAAAPRGFAITCHE